MADTNIRLQNLRDFTVQIRRADTEAIVGTGIAVSTDGKIITCAHVVQAAGVDPRAANGAEVGVYFPQARGGEEKKHRARVDCCFSEHDDDMVLLQIMGGTFPLSPEQIAVLGMADQSEGNPFRTYGYSPIGNYPATRGDGVILGTVEPPEGRNLQVDPVQLKSRDIAAGMSGAAVLDVNRNLVVGLVAERYYADNPVQDDIGYGVDSKVLTFDPFCFVLQGEALALKPAPEFRLDQDLFKQAIEIAKQALVHRSPADKYSWNNTPQVLPEWVGRDDLLAQLNADWNDPGKHVAGLIGFGGEGKSSLARQWVEELCQAGSPSTPTGIFWWGFYENRSVDEFLEAALKYMGGGRIDPRQVPSSSMRVQMLGAMLGAGRYLFVLDGLEMLQHPEGDQYGLLQNNDLRELLTYFARPDNQSFCLVTSRAPLLDLMEYTTYRHHDLDRLSEKDGRDLLRKLDVQGADVELDEVVSEWDGHALTLSILAAYLAERYGGEVSHLADIPIPTANEPRYERVHRVLRRYDENLTGMEREFLILFSAFRTPVQEAAFEKVFKPLLTARKAKDARQEPVPDLQIPDIVTPLVHYRLLRHDLQEATYTTHPLIRNHYFALFTKSGDSQEKAAHEQIKEYYLSIAGDTPQYPTLEELKPLIEVVHHACEAGAYDEADCIQDERICQKNIHSLTYQLGSYETDLTLMLEFFPSGDTSQEPQVHDRKRKYWILNEIGICLMCLGRLGEAVSFYERVAKAAAEAQDWSNTSRCYRNLAELHISLGALEASAEAVDQALELARKAVNKQDEKKSLAYQGRAAHLLGDMKTAGDAFAQAEKLEQEIDPGKRYLYSLAGIWHVEHLRRSGVATASAQASEHARRVSEINLEICEQNHWPDDISRCHHILGDLDEDAGQHEAARGHYDEALRFARGISFRPALIEALLGRGGWMAKNAETLAEVLNLRKGDLAEQTFNDLNEALGYCVESGYRIYEADVRVALGWAWLAVSGQLSALGGQQSAGREKPAAIGDERAAGREMELARAEAERARQMSSEMGYYWGKVDAEEVLGMIK